MIMMEMMTYVGAYVGRSVGKSTLYVRVGFTID